MPIFINAVMNQLVYWNDTKVLFFYITKSFSFFSDQLQSGQWEIFCHFKYSTLPVSHKFTIGKLVGQVNYGEVMWWISHSSEDLVWTLAMSGTRVRWHQKMRRMGFFKEREGYLSNWTHCLGFGTFRLIFFEGPRRISLTFKYALGYWLLHYRII